MASTKETFNLSEAREYIEAQIPLIFDINVSKKIKLIVASFALGYGKALKLEGKLSKNSETEHYEIPLNYMLDMSKDFLTQFCH